jgi:cytoskeletal protein RodZ
MTLELGTTSLAEARLARGLTLEDAERGTRISRRFLIALETHDYSVFPAPVYARGFLRTYCRYLGVDPEAQLAELPVGWAASPPATPLPPVSRGPISLNLSWFIAGALIVTIVGIGLFISRDGEDLGTLQAQEQPQTTGEVDEASEPSEPGREAVIDAPPETTSSGARSLDAGIPGVLPDFIGVSIDDVAGFLEEQGLTYLRIDTRSSITPEGIVIAQAPDAGTRTEGLEQITLTVSTGDTTSPMRTDCGELAASNQRTVAEQAYLEANCATPTPQLADRTNCEEIRGTDYRSPAERAFFLANCIIQ